MSEIAILHPGKLLPFIMFDPRRIQTSGRYVQDRIIKALEKFGFLGVKMYPPLGYHPSHEFFGNLPEVNSALEVVYQYCADHNVPITTHCSPGGAFSLDLKENRRLAKRFAHPGSWEPVLKKWPNLWLNLAHFGGGSAFLKIDDPPVADPRTNRGPLTSRI